MSEEKTEVPKESPEGEKPEIPKESPKGDKPEDENQEEEKHEDGDGEECHCDHKHDGEDEHDHSHCNHDHDHGHNHSHQLHKPRRKNPPRRRREEDPEPYQPPPPPPIYPPQCEPLMIDPPPKFDVPVPKILEDGKVDCISTDPGKVVKTIVKAGIDNKQMHINTRVKCQYVGTLDDGTKFHSSKDRGEGEFAYLYGKFEVIRGFDIALSTMRTGEIADITIQPDYGYGDRVFQAVPPNSVLHFNVELVSYEWEPIEPMDQIEYAGEKREEGNEKAKQGKWQEAIDSYQKGYNFVEVLMIGDPGQHKLGQEMKLAIALNKAHCYLKLNQPEEALKMCVDALKVDPASVKGKFRRGMCYKAMNDYYRAESDFRSALVSVPGDKAILKELASLRAILDPIEKAQSKKFKGKNIFEQMKVEEQREAAEKKERDLRLLEQQKEEEEKRRLRKEKEEEEEKKKLEAEAAEAKKEAEAEGEKAKEKENGGIVKETENALAPASEAAPVSPSAPPPAPAPGDVLVKEEEKDSNK